MKLLNTHLSKLSIFLGLLAILPQAKISNLLSISAIVDLIGCVNNV